MKFERALLLAGIAVMIAACAPDSALRQNMLALRQAHERQLDFPLVCESLDPAARTLLTVQQDYGPKRQLALLSELAGVQTWQSGKGLLMVTHRGRVLRTIGFAEDQRDAAVINGSDPLGQPMDNATTYRFVMRLDLAPEQYGLTAEHELRYVGEEEISGPRRLAHWQEQVRLRELRLSYRQDFWLDPATGIVFRSIQQIGESTRLTLQVIKANN